MKLHIFNKQGISTIALNSNLNDLTVNIYKENLELNCDSNLINQIKKCINKFQINDLGIKFSENSSLQDIKNSVITNRRVQRTKVGFYQIKDNKNKYLLVICDSPIANNGLKAIIKNINYA